ncbi:MAG: hypothetical protein AMXMBFR20_26580 [Planctomycetia bacterium]|nr:hypothetical protein [Planctomycetota bacterium]OQZ05797.1 MAG: hypothetical protein B6D36_08245 [Planctomycetes bacterium UTPLA1]
MSNGMDSAASLAYSPFAGVSSRIGITRWNFIKAALGTAAIVFIFWTAYKFERDYLNRHPADIRYIREASEAAMRYITIPHIIIGFLFLVSSKNNKNVRSRIWTVALLILGGILCALYYRGGGRTDLVLSVGVYFYFLVHELRDEAMFYTVLGEAAPIPDKKLFKGFVRWMVLLIVCSLLAFVLAAAPTGFYVRKMTASDTGLASLGLAGTAWFDGSMSTPMKIFAGAFPLLVVAAGYTYVLRRYSRAFGYDSVRSFMQAYDKFFFVMFGVAAVLGLVIVLTQRFYALILFHVVAWYVFASYQYSRNPPKETPKSWWQWMRTTPKGFKTLHIGMAAILMVIGLVWTIGLNLHPSLDWLLAPESFLYWTIMHITVSFVPR